MGQVPADQFSFKATPETRSIAELLQHVVAVQKVLTGESCRPDTNLMRQSFADHLREYAAEVGSVKDKNGLVELMRSSMEMSEATIRTCGDGLKDSMRRFDGKELTKLDMLNFAVAHEMYHRGQFTVYQRLLRIEPVLTQRLKKLFATSQENSAENAS